VAAQTERVLRRLGVEAIDARPGDPFDPDVHAAAATTPTSDPAQQQRVASQVRRGWRHGPVVIRPAGVAVWLHSPAGPGS
jgi:molecular chaperone GrpE (heat shock protein)